MGKKKWESDTSEIYMANYHPDSQTCRIKHEID